MRAGVVLIAHLLRCVGRLLLGGAVVWGLLGTPAVLAQAEKDRNLVVARNPALLSQSSKRVALVIGNGNYKDAPLTNPVNDARAISQALRESGFFVISHENIDQRAMQAALREFGDRLKTASVGAFYYAGHGMQIKGRNYLVPVGGTIEREDEVAYAAVDAQAVLDKMEAAGTGTNIMILDACRNNPFVRSSRSGSAGLAQMEAPVGTLVAFATSPGAVASDGASQNGLYTQHLLSAMRQPGAKVEDVFKQVRAAVRRDSQGKQIPWESTSLEGDFYFRAPVVSAAVAGDALDLALWEMVKDSQHAVEFRAYLARFPKGVFARQAHANLQRLLAGTPMTSAQNLKPAATDKPVTPALAPNQPAVGNMPDAESLQADIDRRSAELLAELAARPQTASGKKPSAERRRAPPPSANTVGLRVGDRWRYQLVDKYKGEVVDNANRKIERIEANGDLVLNGGRMVTDAVGNPRKLVTTQMLEQNFSDHQHILPARFEVGWKEKFEYVRTYRRSDGFEGRQEWSGTMVVKGKESVTVPAGVFEVWRIERNATANGAQTNGSSRWYTKHAMTVWYSPELHVVVAADTDSRDGSAPADRFRTELTSFEIGNAQLATR